MYTYLLRLRREHISRRTSSIVELTAALRALTIESDGSSVLVSEFTTGVSGRALHGIRCHRNFSVQYRKLKPCLLVLMSLTKQLSLIDMS